MDSPWPQFLSGKHALNHAENGLVKGITASKQGVTD